MIINPYIFIPSVDPDAQAFITAAGITNTNEQSAINTLVVSLKGYSIWTKMKLIYPFVGGSATSNKFNLVNPLDTNAAFRLSFNGGWTHSSTGATPNGTNAYANTYFNPNVEFSTNNSAHLSIYSRTNSATQIDFGVQNVSTITYLITSYNGANAYASVHGSGVLTPNTNSTGFYVATRTSSNVLKLFKNNSQLGSTYTGASGSRGTLNMYLGALNIGGVADYFTNRNYAFASAGDGLTDAESANFYTAVQAFQTTLGRQI